MKIENGWVSFVDERATTHSMTLEQYAKHARDPEFVKARPALEHAEAMAAQAQAEAVAFMAGAK